MLILQRYQEHGITIINGKKQKKIQLIFKIKVKKDIKKGEVKEVVKNYVDKKDGKRNLGEYKTVELYVGYKEIDDENIDYCFRIMDTFVKSTDTIQKFNINSEEDEKYNETNIPLVNGKMLCDNFEKTEINDGDLVEMRFNPNSKNGMYWEPIRLEKISSNLNILICEQHLENYQRTNHRRNDNW